MNTQNHTHPWRETLPIETRRLWLRELTPDDAEFIYNLNSNPEVIKYTGDPPFSSIEEAKQFLIEYDHYDLNGFGRWGVVLKSTDQLIGWCGLKSHENGLIDIGFRFLEEHWRKGYATESCFASIFWAWANTSINSIIGRADLRNKASIAVLEKCGLEKIKEEAFDHTTLGGLFKIDKS